MRIGIDVDDTITNTYLKVLRTVGKHYKIDPDILVEAKMTYDDLGRNKKYFPNYEDFALNNFDNILKNVPLKKDAKKIIKKLHDDGHTICFITARNMKEYHDPYQTTYKYLKDNEIYFDELYVNMEDKGLFCKNKKIDLLIDDNVNQCYKALDNNIKVILFDNIFNQNITTFNRATTWKEVYEIITTML